MEFRLFMVVTFQTLVHKKRKLESSFLEEKFQMLFGSPSKESRDPTSKDKLGKLESGGGIPQMYYQLIDYQEIIKFSRKNTKKYGQKM